MKANEFYAWTGEQPIQVERMNAAPAIRFFKEVKAGEKKKK